MSSSMCRAFCKLLVNMFWTFANIFPLCPGPLSESRWSHSWRLGVELWDVGRETPYIQSATSLMMPLLLMLVDLLPLMLIVSLKVNIFSNVHISLSAERNFFHSTPNFITILQTCDQLPIKLYQRISRAAIPQNLLTDQWARKILLRILKHQIMIKVCHKVPDLTRIKFLYSSQNLGPFLGTCVGLHTLDCRKRGHVFYVIMDPSSRSGGGRGGGHSRGGEACLLVTSLPPLPPG